MALPIYTDVNLKFNSIEQVLALVENCISLGFERVFINNVVSNLQSSKSQKHSSKPHATILRPVDITLSEPSLQTLRISQPKFQQFSRLTAILEDAANTHRLGSPEVQAYDIISVQPTNERTFQMACSTLDIDIICLNFSENLGFSPKRPMIKLALKRGITFEISYSPALKDQIVKRNIISNALSLISMTGGKGIVMSSGADCPLDLRSPADVINLGKLFGMDPYQAKNSITKNCRALLKHAETRKSCKSVISVKNASSLKPEQSWILNPSRTEILNQQTTASACLELSTDDEGSDEVESDNS